MANLGTLTLDLIAKIQGFTGPLEQAERSTEKWRKQVQQSMQVVGTAVGAASAAAVAGLAAITTSTVQSAQEISRQSALSSATTDEFQRFAAGAKAVGIEQDKLADILKDVNEKVGDFLTTGAGGMADFFEKIAPQVGVTAEQFRNLSGPEALGLYVDTLEKAGANQQEMTFHLEALASDATALLPILRNGGEGMKLFADEAQRAGVILSQDTIKRANELNAAMLLVDNSTQGFKNLISTALIPVIADFAKGLGDITRDGALAATVTDDLAGGFRMVAKGAAGTLAAIHLITKSLQGLYTLNEASKGDGSWWETFLPPVRIYRAIENLDKLKESAGNTADELRETALGYGALIDQLGGGNGSSGEDRLQRLAKFLSDFKNLQSGVGSGSGSIASGAAEAADAIEQQIKALEEQAATLGMSTEALALYRLEQAAASEADMARARSALELIDAYQRQEAYKQLLQDLRTEEEQLTDQMRARLAVLDAMKGIGDEERMKVAGRIAGAATTDAPEFGGLAPEVGGPLGELLKIDEAEEKLSEWYSSQLEMLERFRAERADLTATWDAEELALKAEHEAALANIEDARRRASMAAGEEFFGNMAGAAKAFFGENSKLYKAAFAVEKAYAIGKALINVPKSYSDAFAAVVGIPVVGPALAPAAGVAAAAAQVAQAAAIGNINFAGAFDNGGAIGANQWGIVGEYGPEIVKGPANITSRKDTAALLDRALSQVKNSSGGNFNGVQIINNGQPVSARTEMDGKTLKIILDRVESEFMNSMATDGRYAKAITNTYGLKRTGR